MTPIRASTKPIQRTNIGTKLARKRAIKEAMDDYYIIRASWAFGKYGKNSIYTIRRLDKTVVDDQIGRPTWTWTLAEF